MRNRRNLEKIEVNNKKTTERVWSRLLSGCQLRHKAGTELVAGRWQMEAKPVK
jgi:hypothetical protein